MIKICRNCENTMDYGNYKTLSGKKYNYKCFYCNWFDSDEVFESLCTLVENLETQIKYLTVRIDSIEMRQNSNANTLTKNNIIAHDNSFTKTNINKSIFSKENHEKNGDDVVSIISGKSNYSGHRYGTPTNSSLFKNRKK